MIEYNSILKEMLDQVPHTIDKREGSVIYNTLAPTAFLIAQQNYMIGFLTDLLFADTAEGEWLNRVVKDFGLTREPATQAVRQINTYDSENRPYDVPVGSRFAVQDIALTVTEKISTGQFKAVCEPYGTLGNQYSGAILPVDNINGLGVAQLLAEPIIAAREEETDDELRERFYRQARQTPYGGNMADYEQKTLSIEGVGAVKVFNAVTMGGGNVGLVIGDEQGNRASQQLVDEVQALMGINGDGIAPIWHTVTVATATDLPVDVAAQIRLKTGSSFAIVQPVVEETIANYVENIGFNDATVFYAKLVAAILNAHESIVDVGEVTMNDVSENISLIKEFENYQVPTVGKITVTEVK